MSILKAILTTIVFIAFTRIIQLWILLFDDSSHFDLIVYNELINSIIIFASITLFMYLVSKTKSVLPQKTPIQWYLIGAILGCAFVFLQLTLNWIYNQIFQTEYSTYYDYDGYLSISFLIIITRVLLMPIVEELIFREYIQGRLLKKNAPFISILISAILFAGMHFNFETFIYEFIQPNPHKVYLTFFGGLISGFIYYKSKSIGPSILLHICWNMTAYCV